MYERFAKSRIEDALADTRVVLISGSRQSGKTTLASDIAAEEIPFFTLDDATVFAAANDGPVGFLRGMDRGVIDEIQRVPDFVDQLRKMDTTNHSPQHTLPASIAPAASLSEPRPGLFCMVVLCRGDLPLRVTIIRYAFFIGSRPILF